MADFEEGCKREVMWSLFIGRVKIRGLAAVFGAEYNVDCVLSVRVRHVPHLRRLAFLYIVDPARQQTAGWATCGVSRGCPVLSQSG